MSKRTTTVEAWERQPGESAKNYEAFATYRDMGANRSTAKTAQALGKTKTLMDGWSSRWKWVERARLWDLEQDRERQRQWKIQRRKMDDRQIRIAQAMQGEVAKTISAFQSQNRLLMPQQVQAWMDTAAKLERLAMGMPTDRTANQEEPPVPVDGASLDYSRLTSDELELLDRLLAKAAGEPLED